MNSGEDQMGVFAQLYGIPTMSLRNTMWKKARRNETGCTFCCCRTLPDLQLRTALSGQCACAKQTKRLLQASGQSSAG